MRTQDEIVKRMKDHDTFLGFYQEVLFEYLDFEHAKPFLKEEAIPKYEKGLEEWECQEPNREHLLEDMKDYMEFGWEKVLDHRGISASRTIEKMEAWAWLLEDLELERKLDEADYAQYGAPKLAAVCEHLGWPIPKDDRIARMVQGDECYPHCEQGCSG